MNLELYTKLPSFFHYHWLDNLNTIRTGQHKPVNSQDLSTLRFLVGFFSPQLHSEMSAFLCFIYLRNRELDRQNVHLLVHSNSQGLHYRKLE